MKKIIYFLLISTILLNVNTVNAKSIETLKNSCTNKTIIMDELLEDEEVISSIKNYLINEYGENYQEVLIKNQKAVETANKIDKLFSDSKSIINYPSYLGGLYIDEEDNLVIEIVERNIPTKKSKEYNTFKKIVEDYSVDNKIKYVDYSYAELESTHDVILGYMLSDNNSYLTGLYIDVPNNKIVVELRTNTSEEVKKFKENVIDSPFIVYNEERKFTNIVNPGGSLTSTNLGSSCSWGYRAQTSSGQKGMVTAAHCFSGIGDYANGVGIVSKWKNSGNTDAAWVVTTSGTNNLNSPPPFSSVTTISTSVISSFYSGQKIAKLGITTGYTIGSVTNPSYTGTFGTTFTDLVLASMAVNSGDSGGIVMEQTASLGSGFKTAGICKAAQLGTTNMVFTKATNINSNFNITRY